MMNRAEAAEILNMNASASPEEVRKAYQELFTEHQLRLTNAPTPALRSLYLGHLRQLDEARDVLLAAPSADIPPDLPTDQPSFPEKSAPVSRERPPAAESVKVKPLAVGEPSRPIQKGKPGRTRNISIALAIALVLVIVGLAKFGLLSPGGNQADEDKATVKAPIIFTASVSSGKTAVLSGVWGTSASDIWAVGHTGFLHPNGTILHYNGTSWSIVARVTGEHLNSVWGTSASNVWAVGYAGIFHYNGTSWSSVLSGGATELLSGVWGTSASDVWAVGEANTVLHYNGTAWSPRTNGLDFEFLNRVWGTSASNVWAVGGSGIFHYNGTTWSSVASGTSQRLNDVWGTSATDVWAVGDDGTILHYNGTSWSSVASAHNSLTSVWGTSATDVWAVGSSGTVLHYNGTSWSSVQSGTSRVLLGVWGTSASNVWAVGDSGTILHGSPAG